MALLLSPYRFVVSGPSVPSDLSGLVRWYKADSFALSDGDAIGGVGRPWVDQSASALNLTQTTGGNQPLYKTNIFGAMPAIRFSGGQFMDMTTFSGTQYTILCVGAFTGDGMVWGNSAINVQIRVGRSGTNNISTKLDDGSDVFSDTFANAENTVRLMSWFRQNISPANLWRENKTARNSADDGGSTFNINRLGATSFGGNLVGDVGELCIYSGTKTSVEIDSLYDAYFKPRWGLP